MKDIHSNCRIAYGHHFDDDDVCRKCGKDEISLYFQTAYYGFDSDAVDWILRWCEVK